MTIDLPGITKQTDQTDQPTTNHDITEVVEEVISSPKRRRKRAGIARYSKKGKKQKPKPLLQRITRPTTIPPPPTVTPTVSPTKTLTNRTNRTTCIFSIPTPKTSNRIHPRLNQDLRPADDGYTTDPITDEISVDEYIDHNLMLEGLFGPDHLKVRNLSIAYAYRTRYGAPPPEEWGGKDGTICQLARFFKVPKKKRRQVGRVLKEVWECIRMDGRYCDDRKDFGGRPAIIGEGDEEEAIIADWMEQGLGFRHTLAMVNQHRIEHGKIHIGISAIIFAFRRMKPLVTKIRKRTQASVNQVGWADARYNQTK